MHPLAFNIHISNYSYGSIEALKNIHVEIEQGSFTAIVGPNGGGKSTLLKLLADILPLPRSSNISRLQSDPHLIAYLPQSSEIDRTFPLLVEDIVVMGLWPRMGTLGRLPPHARSDIQKILEQVGLQGLEKRPIHALSGGQLQRLFFARLLAQDAPIILLDEPFAAVDPTTTEDLLKILKTWHDQGKTILAVLHDLNVVRRHFPTTLLIAKTIIGHGPTQDILVPEILAKAAFYV